MSQYPYLPSNTTLVRQRETLRRHRLIRELDTLRSQSLRRVQHSQETIKACDAAILALASALIGLNTAPDKGT